MQIEARVVLPKQPEGHIILSEREHPNGIATTDRVFGDTGDNVAPKETVLLLTMKRNPALLKSFCVNRIEIQLDATTDFDGGSKLEFIGVYNWIDEVYYSPFEDDREKADSYDRLDVRATWTSSEGNWVVSGFVNNVFDDIGVLQVLRNGEDEFFRLSAGTTVPRIWGLEVSYSFSGNR